MLQNNDYINELYRFDQGWATNALWQKYTMENGKIGIKKVQDVETYKSQNAAIEELRLCYDWQGAGGWAFKSYFSGLYGLQLICPYGVSSVDTTFPGDVTLYVTINDELVHEFTTKNTGLITSTLSFNVENFIEVPKDNATPKCMINVELNNTSDARYMLNWIVLNRYLLKAAPPPVVEPYQKVNLYVK